MKNEQKKIRSQEATPQLEPKDAPPWTRARVFSDDSDGSCIVMRSETDGDRVVATGTVYKAVDTLADLLRDKDVHELPSPEAAAFLDAHGYNRDGTPKPVARVFVHVIEQDRYWVMRSEYDGEAVTPSYISKIVPSITYLVEYPTVAELSTDDAAAWLSKHGYNRSGTIKTVAEPSPAAPRTVPDTIAPDGRWQWRPAKGKGMYDGECVVAAVPLRNGDVECHVVTADVGEDHFDLIVNGESWDLGWEAVAYWLPLPPLPSEAVPDTTLDAAMAAEMSQVDRYEEAAGENPQPSSVKE